MFTLRKQSVLPGFGLTMGFTLFYLSLIVFIPLAGTFVKTSNLTWNEFWVASPRRACWLRIASLLALRFWPRW